MKSLKIRVLTAIAASVLLGGLALPMVFFLSGYSNDFAIFTYPLPACFLLLSGSDDFVVLTGTFQFMVEGVALAVPRTRSLRLKIAVCIFLTHLIIWFILRKC
jgi:hypothetical protein